MKLYFTARNQIKNKAGQKRLIKNARGDQMSQLLKNNFKIDRLQSHYEVGGNPGFLSSRILSMEIFKSVTVISFKDSSNKEGKSIMI